MKQPFTGAGVALVTPFREDGSVNIPLFESLIDVQLANETAAVVVCGTTGEGSTLTVNERAALFECAAARVNGRVPVICGTGSNSTSFCLQLAKTAEECGADYHLMVTPYYNKTSQQGLIRHYYTLADALQKPIIVYNVPSRTGMNITPKTYAKLAKHDNIIAVKEADPDIGKLTESIARCGDTLTFYSGNDDLTVAACVVGCKGTISVLSNVFPRFTQRLNMLAVQGDIEHAAAMQRKAVALNKALFCDVNPMPVKYAMQMRGFPVGDCRLPLTTLNEDHKRNVREAMTSFAATLTAEETDSVL
ncbi:MAG: 4-hydroxy-tetrahydrodipicolinate synthase [Clostridia bacterium]|nr:4-hydroxy-tetrahydrodipicolinate synthase [Clostridia bacterium]